MPKRKITNISPQVRNPKRKTLTFDDGSVFGISEDVFVLYNFKIDEEIDEDLYNTIFIDETKSKIFNSAVRLLSYRMRSCNELKKRLIEKKYPENLIDKTIDKLLEMGYLNDLEFAEAFAHDKVNNRMIGPIALRNEFGPYYIDSEVIDRAISSVYNNFPTKKLIEQLIAKKKFKPGSRLDQKTKKRLIDFLKRKGFTWNDISQVLSDLNIKI
jgi:regulatory protein